MLQGPPEELAAEELKGSPRPSLLMSFPQLYRTHGCSTLTFAHPEHFYTPHLSASSVAIIFYHLKPCARSTPFNEDLSWWVMTLFCFCVTSGCRVIRLKGPFVHFSPKIERGLARSASPLQCAAHHCSQVRQSSGVHEALITPFCDDTPVSFGFQKQNTAADLQLSVTTPFFNPCAPLRFTWWLLNVSFICKTYSCFGVEPLLLYIERSQLRRLWHLVWMPPEPLPEEVFRPCPTGWRPSGRPGTDVSQLVWERLGVQRSWRKWLERGSLGIFAWNPVPCEWKKMDGSMDNILWIVLFKLWSCFKSLKDWLQQPEILWTNNIKINWKTFFFLLVYMDNTDCKANDMKYTFIGSS